MKEILRYPNCFVCGTQNPHGLRLRFFWNGMEATTRLSATETFEGYKGIYHGGVIGSVLDEVMLKAILAQERYAVTAEMTVRYLEPIRVGDEITCSGRITNERRRVILTEGEARRSDGTVLAKATGKYIEAVDSLKQDLKASIED